MKALMCVELIDKNNKSLDFTSNEDEQVIDSDEKDANVVFMMLKDLRGKLFMRLLADDIEIKAGQVSKTVNVI